MSTDRVAPQRHGELHGTDQSSGLVQAVVGLTTTVATSISGVYVVTRSVIVTALVAGLIMALVAGMLVYKSRWAR
ncbi:hypothetical protein [Lentzea sp. CA-135723]|uniref:hypothetical protein n=1 Tax=Lentzea sp. CA-135723 TaxID=3239950 RepID=UPI003D8C1DC9